MDVCDQMFPAPAASASLMDCTQTMNQKKPILDEGLVAEPGFLNLDLDLLQHASQIEKQQ